MAIADRRITIDLSYPTGWERYAFQSKFDVGGDPSLNGTNKTTMNLLIDTRNQGIFLFDSNCTTCSNANKYSFNENSTKGDIDTKNVRHTAYLLFFVPSCHQKCNEEDICPTLKHHER
jgi:hypothetical protein